MTTKCKKTYGIEIAVFSTEPRPSNWDAFLFLYDVEKETEGEYAGRWVNVHNPILELLRFEVRGSDYRWEDTKHRAGLNCFGDWKIQQTSHYESVHCGTMLEAAKLGMQLEKAMIRIADKWGDPATPADVLKRALLAARPAAVRINSAYSGTTSDARNHWQDVTKARASYIDCLIAREISAFQKSLKERRPDLFAERQEAAS